MKLEERSPHPLGDGPVEGHLAVQYRVGRLLSESQTLEGLPEAILQIARQGLDWDVGAWWEATDAELKCVAFCAAPGIDSAAFEDATHALAMASGVGLPGRVRAEGEPVSIVDLELEGNFPRLDAARAGGLRSAIAFPIRAGEQTLAVVELFSRQRREPDPDLLRTLATLGAQVGNFVERRRAEDALRESEERYRRLVESSPEPIAVHQDGILVYVNPAAVEMWGGTGPEDLLGRRILDLIHEDYQPLVNDRIRRVLERGETAELIEEKFLRLDGRVIDVEVIAIRTIFYGRPAYQLMVREITQRKLAEAERRLAEERYLDLFQSAVFGVFQTTPDAHFLNANAALARMFGFDSAEDLMREVVRIDDQLHTDPVRRAEFAALLESHGSVTGFEAKARRRDGSLIDISLSGRVVRGPDGRPDHYEGFVEDITLRKQAEEQLREQKRVLETIEQVGASLASELDLNKTVQSVIDATTELTGAQLGAFFFKRVDENGEFLTLSTASGADSSLPDSFEIARHSVLFDATFRGVAVLRSEDITREEAYSGGGPPLRIRPGDRPVRSYLAVPVVSRNGDVIGGLFFGHEAPGVFEERHETLAAGIARWAGIAIDNATLYTEAQNVQEELRRANEAKDEFLGLISHELRTPITTIYGGARLLQSRADRLEQARKDEILGDIEQESERLYRLVEDLLALARTELGASISLRPVMLQRVAERTIAAFEKRRPNRPLEVQMPNGLPPIQADPTYIEQILLNLLGNADKYSPPDSPIALHAGLADGSVEVELMDRGSGLAAGEAERIFERFYRSDRTARQASGLGIGLTVCKRLVEAQQGRIWARDREGGGLIVGFSIPVAIEDVPEVQ